MVSSKCIKEHIIISIIVPCYNQEEYLHEALESVLNQTYPNWECIVVNDGSTDDTGNTALFYTKKDNRIKYLYKENGGLSSARNAGIKSAKGEFILPLDADDIIAPQYIELSLKSFFSNKELTLVYCKANKFGHQNEEWNLPLYSFREMLLSNCIFCSAIYRKTEWEKHNGYNEALKKGWEDWDFWIKILNHESKVYRIPHILFYYRTKSHSMITSFSKDEQRTAAYLIYFNNLKKYESQFDSPIAILNKNIELNISVFNLNSTINKIINSYSYKLGNFLIKPLSTIKTYLLLFNKK